LRARIFVWKAMSSITLMIFPSFGGGVDLLHASRHLLHPRTAESASFGMLPASICLLGILSIEGCLG
jgi:hypothetical protein